MLELTLVVFLFPLETAKETLATEKADIRDLMGENTSEEIYSFAKESYKALLIDTGLYGEVYHFFVPTEEEIMASGGLEALGTREGWFSWIGGRLEMASLVFYEFLVRWGFIKAWLPYLLILMLPTLGVAF